MSKKITELTANSTIVDADQTVFVDVSDTTQSSTGTNKKTAWSLIKSTLKTYFDTLYAVKSQTEFISGFIESPADQDYKLIVKIPHGGTITETTTISASGTCTATFKINTTALGGTANSVSSSEQSQAHASANAFSADDDIVLTVSSNSSCADMSFTIKYTKTLS